MVRPAAGGMVGVCARTLIPAILLLVLGKHTTWGWSWVQSKTYDPGGSCRCALQLSFFALQAKMCLPTPLKASS